MKRRVIRFFSVLVILAIVLTLVAIFNFNGISGFAISNSVIKSYSIPNVTLQNEEGMIFGLAILAFVFIASFIVHRFEKNRERHHSNLITNKQPFSRKLINISYD